MVRKWEGGRRIPPNLKFLLRQKFVCKWWKGKEGGIIRNIFGKNEAFLTGVFGPKTTIVSCYCLFLALFCPFPAFFGQNAPIWGQKSRVKTVKGREDNLISHNPFLMKRKFSPKRRKGYTHLTDHVHKGVFDTLPKQGGYDFTVFCTVQDFKVVLHSILMLNAFTWI